MDAIGTELKGAVRRLFRRQETKAAQGAAKAAKTVARDRLELSATAAASAAAATTEIAGATDVGKAVNQAVAKANSGVVPRDKVFTKGSLEELWINDHDLHNEAMDRLAQAIKGAKHEIRIQNFEFEADSEAGKTLLKALSEKQKLSPDFKVYLIHRGDFTLFKDPVNDAFTEHGVDAVIAGYLKTPHRGMDHEKLFVIDGNTGLIGGINIQDKDFQDVLVKVKGDVVDTMLADFDQAFAKSKVKVQIQDGAVRSADGFKLPPAIKAESAPATGPTIPMTYLSRDSIAVASLHGKPYANDADQGILAALHAAQREIRIVTPNITDREVWSALAAAADRGVQIKLVVPKGFNQRTSLVDFSNNELFISQFLDKLPERSRQNVEMRWFSPDGQTLANNHTKYMSVDGQWAYVGSQNMDKQSFVYSREAGLGIDDAAATRQLDAALFDQDWQRGIRITPDKKPDLLESLGF